MRAEERTEGRASIPDPLTPAEIDQLTRTFPELDWIKPEDWQTVAGFADFRNWIDEYAHRENYPDDGLELYRMLKLRRNRVHVRQSCRDYWGEANVDNINDPAEDTWA